MGETIAIIGGGVAGLCAGYLLRDRYPITLFEKSRRLGGNAFTLTTRDGYELDIAVAAFGKAGYPNFYKLLEQLGIATDWCPSSYMSMFDLDRQEGLFLTPFDLAGLWAQRFAMFSPKNLLSVAKAYLGVQRAIRALRRGELAGLSMAQALQNAPLLRGQSRRLLLCALCLMSSMSADEVMASPAAFFFSKLSVHSDVLSPRAIYSVRCVANKTRSYVDALSSSYRERVVFESAIQTVKRSADGVCLVHEGGHEQRFDKVIFACNADQALALLAEPTPLERELLGKWTYKDGDVVLHRDSRSFPRRELMQAYTFLYTEREERFDTSVSGSLWHLPGVDDDCPYISTQHPNFPIDPALIEHQTVLRTPLFDHAAHATIERLPELNGQHHSFYCGSHFGHGLHEDAVRSATDVARALGVQW